MYDNHLVIHHVGGRAGSRDFPILTAFEDGIINVMYEADESCLQQIMSVWKNYPSKTIVLPYCLSASEGTCKFHINYDPFSSSIFPLNPKYMDYYYPDKNSGYDYVLGDTFRSMEKVHLQTTTLDTVVLKNKEVPSPDFLSIDTQGSELDILIGAKELLGGNILAVSTEIALHPLYDGMPLFGDICQYLEKYNFDLVDMQLFSKLHPIRGKLGFRGEGYAAHGEALFLKRPTTDLTKLQLNKLAFIATVFGQFECAQQCFETNGFELIATVQGKASNEKPNYLEFISRLSYAVANLPRRSMPIFSDVYSYAKSSARFQSVSPPFLPQKFLNTVPYLVYVRSRSVALGNFLKRVLRWTQRQYAKAIRNSRWWLRRPGSEVEEIFLEFGMKKQFLLSMKNRIEDSGS